MRSQERCLRPQQVNSDWGQVRFTD
jgi:hypothetical protein